MVRGYANELCRQAVEQRFLLPKQASELGLLPKEGAMKGQAPTRHKTPNKARSAQGQAAKGTRPVSSKFTRQVPVAYSTSIHSEISEHETVLICETAAVVYKGLTGKGPIQLDDFNRKFRQVWRDGEGRHYPYLYDFAIKNTLDKVGRIVWADDNSFWLFDWKKDGVELASDLERKAVIGREYSVRYFFSGSDELMARLGVCTPEELFEIYRRVYLSRDDGPTFGDELSVGFGDLDRRTQIRKFVEDGKGANKAELARRYEEQTGFPAASVEKWLVKYAGDLLFRLRQPFVPEVSQGNIVLAEDAIGRFHEYGPCGQRTHQSFPEPEIEYLKEQLVGDCCSLDLVRNRFLYKFPNGEGRFQAEAFSLGYREDNGLLFHLDVSPQGYFNRLLSKTRSFSFGDPGFESAVARHPDFKSTLKHRIRNYQTLVYDKGVYMDLEALSIFGNVSLKDVNSYGHAVRRSVRAHTPFTVKSLHESGNFSHPLADLEMPIPFYESLISIGNDIDSCTFAGTKVFNRDSLGSFTASDFLIHVVGGHEGIDRESLTALLGDTYGIEVSSTALAASMHNAQIFCEDNECYTSIDVWKQVVRDELAD